jgi:hypothetical protein
MNFDQKNVLNMNIPSIHLFAYCIMSFDDSYACSPNIYAEYFGTPPRVSPAPLYIEVDHPCHAIAMLNNL